MGIIDEDGFIKQPSQFWDLGVVAIAAVFTLCIIALFFFSYKVPSEKPSNEISVGIGAGSTIHPRPNEGAGPGPLPNQPAKPSPKP